MTEIAVAHQLYFYQLFGSTIGIGRQVSVAQVAEVLASDDIDPADVGAAGVDELLGALSAFVKVTTFRHGRVVATMLRNDELDEALAKANSATDTKRAPRGKPWKARGTKAVMPTKPRPAPGRHADGQDVKGASAGKDGAGDVTAHEMEPGAATTPTTPGTPDPGAPEAGLVAKTVDTTSPAPMNPQVGEKETGETEAQAGGRSVVGCQTKEAGKADRAHTATKRQADVEAQPDMEPSISLTITYDPAATAGQASEGTTRQGQREAARRGLAEEAAKTPALRLPARFSDDVYCPDAMLLELCAELPLGSDYMAALDAAWASAVKGEPDARHPVSFAVPWDTGAAMATIRRRRPTPSGRRWELTAVEVSQSQPENS